VLKRIRVLLVDDSPVALNGLQGILRNHSDIEIVGEAGDGVEAICKAEALRPDVILMDAQMPGMDGVEAARRIKTLLPCVKVLFMAVHAAHINAALEAGADGFVMKDCGRQELLEETRKLGSRGRFS
jgi:DNA-binding NarL/FixJ family response regulator